MATLWGFSLKIAGSIVLLVVVAGCAEFSDGSLFQRNFWAPKTDDANIPHTELGITELTKGNFVAAASHLDAAVKANPTNIYALYARAVLYEHAGDMAQARSIYEQILTLRPPETSQMMTFGGLEVVPVDRSAASRLRDIDNQPQRSLGAFENNVAVAPLTLPDSTEMPREAVNNATFDEQELNVINRFEILRTLRDANLVTPMEYAQRRNANIGALLPLTSSPPALGLERPIPSSEEVQGRLQAIRRALEMRAMTIGQHDSERVVIIDALLPPSPVSLAAPGLPPADILEGADMVRRIEKLREVGLISGEEYEQERAAIVASLEARDSASQSAQMRLPPMSAGQAAPLPALVPSAGGRQAAVHLASYRSEGAAARGWALLKRRYGALGSLNSEVSRIDLGAGKGIFYRLKAGPLASEGAARALCQELKQRRQYCEPSFIPSG